jgi:hypothetical protein
MPATTTYGVDLLVELAIGRASDAGRWGQSDWAQSRWGRTDTALGDWVDVTCDVLDDVRLTAGSNTSDGVTRRWESASAAFTLDGSQWDPWNGPHADVIGDRVPVRIAWRPTPPDVPVVVPRTNMTTNPSFETSTAGWITNNALTTRVADHAVSGAFAARVQATSTTASADLRLTGGGASSFPAGIVPGGTYTVSATIDTPVPHTTFNTASGSRQRRIMFLVSTNGASFVENFGPQGTNTVGPQRISHTFTVPAGATGAHVAVGCAGSATDPAFVTYVDAVLIEPVAALGPYFDGSTPDTSTVDYAWTGPAHASTSTATPVAAPAPAPWTPAFTGYVATRGYAWNPGEQQAGVACVDGTSVLVASDRVPSPPAGAGETAAARVLRVAAAALWPAAVDVIAGGTALQATTLDATAWDELLQVADTDLALLWINRAGALAFRPRGRVGQGVVLAGRLVVCPDGPDDVQVMTLGRNQPSVTRNRIEIARRKDEARPGDEPAVARLEDRQSIARYQSHDFKRTDLWHVEDGWSHTVAQAVLGAGAWPSPAPGELALDTISGDERVPALLLSVEPDMAFDVVDDGGRTYRQAVVGWDMAVRNDGIEAVLHVEDVTRWSNVGHWGTAHWGTDRWGIGGI